jgi:hypothetical protein
MMGLILIEIQYKQKNYGIMADWDFPPFHNLVQFLRNIIENRMPTQFEMYEKTGPYTILSAENTDRNDVIRFVLSEAAEIGSSKKGPITIKFEGQFNRKEFVNEFVTRFRFFLDSDYKPEYWEQYGSKMPYSKLKELEDYINKLAE